MPDPSPAGQSWAVRGLGLGHRYDIASFGVCAVTNVSGTEIV